MKIAILADIHGNVPALEAVIRDLEEVGVDRVLLGGDLVGRGPEGAKVARRVRELGWPSVRGNHEDYLLAFRRAEVPGPWLHSEEWSAARWMASQLDAADVQYLERLPFSLVPEGLPPLCLVHGSPASSNEGLGPWSTDGELSSHLDSIGEPLLVCAHTHRPMDRTLGRRRVVNVGAVGLPFNRDRRAQYVVLHAAGGTFQPEFRAVGYSVDAVLDLYRSTGFLEAGGVTAELLRLELVHAAPFLVPFLQWAGVVGEPVEQSRVVTFLEFYDPDEPLRRFAERLEGIKRGARSPLGET